MQEFILINQDEVAEVLDTETVQQMKTNEIGEQVRQCINSASC